MNFRILGSPSIDHLRPKFISLTKSISKLYGRAYQVKTYWIRAVPNPKILQTKGQRSFEC